MSDAKHTPGPWTYQFNVNFDLHPRVMAKREDGEMVCIASTIGTKTTRDKLSLEEKSTNAHLIAAAPDLLAALEALFASYKRLADSGDAGNWSLEDYDEGKQALAAIAKAKGEPA